MEAMAIVTDDKKSNPEFPYPNTYTFDLFGGVDVSLLFSITDSVYCMLFCYSI